jgi:sec-independent protein translocase protein TatA
MFSLFGPIGLPEMLIILAIVILIFGANRLPELGKGIGAGIKNFKSSMKGRGPTKVASLTRTRRTSPVRLVTRSRSRNSKQRDRIFPRDP